MVNDEPPATPKPLAEIDDFWDRVSSTPRRLLGLDYDGTLAPFDPDRMKAEPLEGVRDLIREINKSSGTRIAIFSGRPVAEIQKLLDQPDITIVGSHGHEVYEPGRDVEEFQPTPIQKIGLERGIEIAREFDPGENLEVKIASVAMHTRPLPEEKTKEIEDALYDKWSDIGDAHQLECRRFNGGVELRCSGWDKGSALLRIVRIERPGITVYVGDDDTDEDAFEVVRDMGVGIRIGDKDSPTLAQAFLPGPQAVVDFLDKWKSVTSGGT